MAATAPRLNSSWVSLATRLTPRAVGPRRATPCCTRPTMLDGAERLPLRLVRMLLVQRECIEIPRDREDDLDLVATLGDDESSFWPERRRDEQRQRAGPVGVDLVSPGIFTRNDLLVSVLC